MPRGQQKALERFNKIPEKKKKCQYLKWCYESNVTNPSPCKKKATSFVYDEDGDIYYIYCKKHASLIQILFRKARI